MAVTVRTNMVPHEQLLRRRAKALEAGQAAMWLARELAELPLAAVGDAFGAIKPAAVCNQVAACRRRIETDRRWAAKLRLIKPELTEM